MTDHLSETAQKMLAELYEKRRKGRLTRHHLIQKSKAKKQAKPKRIKHKPRPELVEHKPNPPGSGSRGAARETIKRGKHLVMRRIDEQTLAMVARLGLGGYLRRFFPADDFGTGPDRMRRIQDDAARQMENRR